MTEHRCIDPGQLDEVQAAPERLERARGCTRCSALLREHEAFLNARVPQGADPEDAERRLGGVLEVHARRAAPRRRPALIAVAMAAAVAAILLLPRGESPHEPPALRDAGTQGLGLHAPDESRDAWNLRWSAHPDADAYELRLYDVDLRELMRLGPVLEPQARVAKEDFELEPTLLWRVYALRGGDEIWRSEVGVLRQGD